MLTPAHRKKTAPALVRGASLEFFHNRSDFYKMKSNFLLEFEFFLLHNAREYSSGISGPATFIWYGEVDVYWTKKTPTMYS